MDVNFIAAAEELVPVPIPPSPSRNIPAQSPITGRNNNNNNSTNPNINLVPAPVGPLFLVPPTPPPPSAYLSRYTPFNSNSNTATAATSSIPQGPSPSAPSTTNRIAPINNLNIFANNSNTIESLPSQPTLVVSDTPPPTRRSLHNYLFDSQSPAPHVPLTVNNTTGRLSANDPNINPEINNNRDISNSAHQDLISFPLQFHPRQRDDAPIINTAPPTVTAAMEQLSSFRIPRNPASAATTAASPATSVLPAVNVTRQRDINLSSSRPPGPTSITSSIRPQRSISEEQHRQLGPTPQQIREEFHHLQLQHLMLESNSTNATTPSAQPHIPLFPASHESNPNLDSTTTPNPINTATTTATSQANPNNIAILPPINISNAARYPSSSTPAALHPHLPLTTTGVGVPTIPLIPPNAIAPPPRSHHNDIFQAENQRKRKRIDTPAAPVVIVEKKEADAKAEIDNEDDNCCSICLEPWNRQGPHQLSCLPCGHLFGRSCIDQWLKKKKICPNCKFSMKGKKATLIFGVPHRLVTVDHGEIDAVKGKLKEEKEAHEKTRKRLKSTIEQNSSLKSRLRQLNSLQVLGASTGSAPVANTNANMQPAAATHHAVQQIQHHHNRLLRNSNTNHHNNIRNSTRMAQARVALSVNERRIALMNAMRSVHGRRIIEDSHAPPGLTYAQGLGGPLTIRRNRPQGLLDVAARLRPNVMPTPNPVVEAGGFTGTEVANNNNSGDARMEVALMFEIRTNGGSRALAFDDSGNVIYNEKKNINNNNNNNNNTNNHTNGHNSIIPLTSTMGVASGLISNNSNSNNMVQKICRRPIVGNGPGGVTSRCRAEIIGRVNDICANTHAGSAYRGYLAVCVQSKKVLILNRALDEVVSYATPAVPMCAWWVGSDAAGGIPNSINMNSSHVLLVGLVDGHIMAFDMQNTSLGPMAVKKFSSGTSGGPPAVHSIAQVNNSTTILAATPTRILKVTFGAFANTINLQQVLAITQGELCSSMAVHRDLILVSTRQNNHLGKHTLYRGLAPGNNAMGPTLHADLAGHKMASLFDQAAVLACNADDDPLVLAPDAGDSARYTRYWQRTSNNNNLSAPHASTWTSAQIAPYPFSGTPEVSQPPVVKSLLLPNSHSTASAVGSRFRIGNDPMVGMAAHLSDNTLQIFSVVRR